MTTEHTSTTPATDILVVDDTIESLKLLTEILTRAGYRVRPVNGPQLALESALAHPPDLILLDVRMPEMDGFEVCHRLKQDERTADIPIIFVSALQDVEDRVQGFETGGVDFVSKPFQELEVLARVKTHLQLRTMQLYLEALVAERTTELRETNKALRTEIAERKRAEQTLRESEKRFRATFEQAAVGIAHVALDGSFLRLNRKFCDIVGYSNDEILTRTFQDITHPDDLNTDLEYVRQLLAGEVQFYSMEKRYFCKNGKVVWVNLTGSLLRKRTGEPDYFVAVVEDITKRKRAETQLRFQAHLLEAVEQAVIVTDLEGHVLYWNPFAEQLYGWSAEEAMGRTTIELIASEQAQQYGAEIMARLKASESWSGEYLARRRDGTSFFINTTLTPIYDEHHELKNIIGISVDITERKQAEQNIQQYQQRLKALASQLTIVEERERRRIAADLHDEVGQTLAFARIQLATAREDMVESEAVAMLDDVSNTIRQAIRDTRDLVFDLSSPLLNELGLPAALAEWLEEQVARKHGLQTEFKLAGEKIVLDEDMRAILFRNTRELLTNVVKHAQASKVSVRLARVGDEALVIVEDDGNGFDPLAAAETTGREGGFGLFSIRERMLDLGGSLEIVSEPGQGCTAILTAPLGNNS